MLTMEVVMRDNQVPRQRVCYMVAGGQYVEGTTNGPEDTAWFLKKAGQNPPIDIQMRAASGEAVRLVHA